MSILPRTSCRMTVSADQLLMTSRHVTTLQHYATHTTNRISISCPHNFLNFKAKQMVSCHLTELDRLKGVVGEATFRATTSHNNEALL
jgi:hypothetical protein